MHRFHSSWKGSRPVQRCRNIPGGSVGITTTSGMGSTPVETSPHRNKQEWIMRSVRLGQATHILSLLRLGRSTAEPRPCADCPPYGPPPAGSRPASRHVLSGPPCAVHCHRPPPRVLFLGPLAAGRSRPGWLVFPGAESETDGGFGGRFPPSAGSLSRVLPGMVYVPSAVVEAARSRDRLPGVLTGTTFPCPPTKCVVPVPVSVCVYLCLVPLCVGVFYQGY